jgi:RHS repeat-associated protein
VWQWDHDPFGNGLPTGTFSYNLRFPGQFYDRNTRLHYNYFRDYDPRTGRYIESDPIGLGGGINTYHYVGGNPLRNIDPKGLDNIDAPSDAPALPDPSEPYEGYGNIRKGVRLFAAGCSIDLTYYGMPVGLIYQGVEVSFVLYGSGQIGEFLYDTYRLEEYQRKQFGPFGVLNPNTPFGSSNPETPFGPANRNPIVRLCPGPGCGPS